MEKRSFELLKHLNQRLNIDRSPSEAEEEELKFDADQLELKAGFHPVEADNQIGLIMRGSQHQVAHLEFNPFEI